VPRAGQALQQAEPDELADQAVGRAGRQVERRRSGRDLGGPLGRRDMGKQGDDAFDGSTIPLNGIILIMVLVS
jgi:hypothetical protein